MSQTAEFLERYRYDGNPTGVPLQEFINDCRRSELLRECIDKTIDTGGVKWMTSIDMVGLEAETDLTWCFVEPLIEELARMVKGRPI